MSELSDLREQLDKYRAVTLQHFDVLSEEEMGWRPRADAFTCSQQLLHIIQTEDCFTRGLFANDWQLDRLRLPKPMPPKAVLLQLFKDVRADTLKYLSRLSDDDLGKVPPYFAMALLDGMRPDLQARLDLGGV